MARKIIITYEKKAYNVFLKADWLFSIVAFFPKENTVIIANNKAAFAKPWMIPTKCAIFITVCMLSKHPLPHIKCN